MNFPSSLQNTLHEAAFHNDVKACRTLIAHGADVNERHDAGRGACPTHWAVANDSLETLKCLHEAKADLKKPTYNGEETLAAWTERYKGHLLAGTAWYISHDIDGKNFTVCLGDPQSAGHIGSSNKDETPLHWAAKYGSSRSLKYL